jgi:PIN domain nuclease of toxin-antitoxin system
VRLLLDAHALLWWLADDRRLSEAARQAIRDPDNQPIVSVVAGYEIAYKRGAGRLPALEHDLRNQLRRERFEILPLTLDHSLAAAELPGPHRDL